MRRDGVAERGGNMAETALTVAVLLLALFGCAQGIRWLVGKCMCGDVPTQAYVVLPLSGHCEDVEMQVRACLYATDARLGVLVVDKGLDDGSRLLAQGVCERLDRVQFCTDLSEQKFCADSLQVSEKGI